MFPKNRILIVYASHFVPNITMGTLCRSMIGLCAERVCVVSGAPILSCVAKGVPGIYMDCHMMVAQPEKVSPIYCIFRRHGETDFSFGVGQRHS